MLPCRQVIAKLWDYLDGELSPDEMAGVADHLAMCGRCYPLYRFEFSFLEAIARQRDALARVPADWRRQVKAVLTAVRDVGDGPEPTVTESA